MLAGFGKHLGVLGELACPPGAARNADGRGDESREFDAHLGVWLVEICRSVGLFEL
jgi:hypothetical protein